MLGTDAQYEACKTFYQKFVLFKMICVNMVRWHNQSDFRTTVLALCECTNATLKENHIFLAIPSSVFATARHSRCLETVMLQENSGPRYCGDAWISQFANDVLKLYQSLLALSTLLSTHVHFLTLST